jgi:hypothetical protein
MTANPSIERTFQRPLRALRPAAHVERWAAKLNLMKSKPDARVVASLEQIRSEMLLPEPSVERLRLLVTDLLTFLASGKGRTDSNCRFVDYGLMNDDDVWSRIELVESADPILAEVLGDMAGALHDTVRAPNIARNFDSTPEQLLARLGSSAPGG